MSKQCASLHYVSAAHGGWGIVRMAALVPEAHLLFVCPSACGRHNAIGGAVSGIKQRVSYLFLTEADIVSGDFEQMIVDNVDILFGMLPKKPKALLIFTSCLDDLLGTDHEPILEELSRRIYTIVRYVSPKKVKMPFGKRIELLKYFRTAAVFQQPTDKKKTKAFKKQSKPGWLIWYLFDKKHYWLLYFLVTGKQRLSEK